MRFDINSKSNTKQKNICWLEILLYHLSTVRHQFLLFQHMAFLEEFLIQNTIQKKDVKNQNKKRSDIMAKKFIFWEKTKVEAFETVIY